MSHCENCYCENNKCTCYMDIMADIAYEEKLLIEDYLNR